MKNKRNQYDSVRLNHGVLKVGSSPPRNEETIKNKAMNMAVVDSDGSPNICVLSYIHNMYP